MMMKTLKQANREHAREFRNAIKRGDFPSSDHDKTQPAPDTGIVDSDMADQHGRRYYYDSTGASAYYPVGTRFTDGYVQPETIAAGEWRIFEHYRNTTGEQTRILDSAGLLVAEAQTGEQAATIVANHNALSKLVAALGELLVEAEVSNVLWQQSRGFTGTVQDAYEKGLMPPAYIRARDLLAAVRGE